MDASEPENLNLWLSHSKILSGRKHNIHLLAGSFCGTTVYTYIINICSQLRTSKEVFFKCFEYIERFIFYHSEINDVNIFPADNRGQILLNFVAILQIVTKLVNRHKVLKTTEAHKVLRRLGCNFNNNAILLQELYILGLFQDDLSCRTIEDCVEVLSLTLSSVCDVHKFSHVDDLLIFVYYMKPYIFCSLRQQKIEFTSQFDFYLFIASGVILSCSMIEFSHEVTKCVLSHLSKIVHYDETSILEIASLVLHSV